MQTKVLIILAILMMNVLVACTKSRTLNDDQKDKITYSHDTLNDASSPEAAFESPAGELEEAKLLVENSTPTPAQSLKKPSIGLPPSLPVSRDSIIEIPGEKIQEIKPELKQPGHSLEAEKGPTDVSHDMWNQLLQRYVSASGKVNYNGLKAEKSQLETYLKLLSENIPTRTWSRNEQLAYWINLYNASTVKLILDNYPLKSITDLGKPWDKPFIKVGSQTFTLNHIENEIIRPLFQEPRIHFAVNCAARSCPPLLNEAFTGTQLNDQLEKQTRAFVNSSANKLSAGKVELSKIFDWYGSDFGDLLTFLEKYSSLSFSEKTKISFLEYDWALNE